MNIGFLIVLGREAVFFDTVLSETNKQHSRFSETLNVIGNGKLKETLS